MIDNLRQLINHDFLQTSTPTPPSEDHLEEKLAELHKKMSGSNLLKEVRRATGDAKLKVGDYTACFWQDENEHNTWYIGRISRIIASRSCRTCQQSGLEELKDSLDEPCYEMHYLTESNEKFVLTDIEEYHTLASQVLCKVKITALPNANYRLDHPEYSVLDSLIKTNRLFSALD